MASNASLGTGTKGSTVLDQSFGTVQCCGTGTVGTVTFTLAELGTAINYVSINDYGSGTGIVK
jgi:hypothetical protein